jgi:hypothetical protein
VGATLLSHLFLFGGAPSLLATLCATIHPTAIDLGRYVRETSKKVKMLPMIGSRTESRAIERTLLASPRRWHSS